jgi:hypothetical protein
MPRVPTSKKFINEPILNRKIPHLFSNFYARRFAEPSVIWINERYWLQEGYDLSDANERKRLDKWLLDNCAFAVPHEEDAESTFLAAETQLWADRYGAATGSTHGGSGRAAALSELNLKGIGRTTLCGPAIDKYHSDGRMWLREAIRDTIYSELAWLECPHGAIPSIAIIDTGAYGTTPDGDKNGRRVILVRPFSLRFAHLERSIHFGKGGSKDSEQFLDSIRVKNVFSFLSSEKYRLADEASLENIIKPVAQQIGSCRFWRLSHDFISSNIGINGEILDFGGFYSVPNWHHVKRETSMLASQKDFSDFVATIHALSFYAVKYGEFTGSMNAAHLINKFEKECEKQFDIEVDSLLNYSECPSIQNEVSIFLKNIYRFSQNFTDDYAPKIPKFKESTWIYDALRSERVPQRFDPASRMCIELNNYIRHKMIDDNENVKNTAALLYRKLLSFSNPRIELYKHILEVEIDSFINLNDIKSKDIFKINLSKYIQRKISISRRKFYSVEKNEVVVAYSYANPSEFICYENVITGDKRIVINTRSDYDNIFIGSMYFSKKSIIRKFITNEYNNHLTINISVDKGYSRLFGLRNIL